MYTNNNIEGKNSSTHTHIYILQNKNITNLQRSLTSPKVSTVQLSQAGWRCECPQLLWVCVRHEMKEWVGGWRSDSEWHCTRKRETRSKKAGKKDIQREEIYWYVESDGGPVTVIDFLTEIFNEMLPKDNRCEHDIWPAWGKLDYDQWRIIVCEVRNERRGPHIYTHTYTRWCQLSGLPSSSAVYKFLMYVQMLLAN